MNVPEPSEVPRLRHPKAPSDSVLAPATDALARLTGNAARPEQLLADLRPWTRRDTSWRMLDIDGGWVLALPPRLPRRHIGENRRRHLIACFARTCVYCVRTGTALFDPDGRPWSPDHYLAKARGRTCSSINIVLACERCNNDKVAELWFPGYRKNVRLPGLCEQPLLIAA
jgi:hypothetical protein